MSAHFETELKNEFAEHIFIVQKVMKKTQECTNWDYWARTSFWNWAQRAIQFKSQLVLTLGDNFLHRLFFIGSNGRSDAAVPEKCKSNNNPTYNSSYPAKHFELKAHNNCVDVSGCKLCGCHAIPTANSKINSCLLKPLKPQPQPNSG